MQALGIRLVNNVHMVQLAKNAGFDSLFIELEHSTMSIEDAANLSFAGLALGITPIVRVPHQCGNGFVQKVLDGGAMGVIFPHVSTPGTYRPSTSSSLVQLKHVNEHCPPFLLLACLFH